jgi:hypothetical protein
MENLMKKFAFVFVLVSAVAFGQNAPIPTKTFSFNANAISLPGDRGTFVGTDAGLEFTPTQNFALGETNILSSDGRVNFFGGGAAYSFPILSKYINDKTPTISGFRFRLGLRAFVGVDRVKDATGSVAQHWGEVAQATFAYSLNSGGTWNMGANVGVARFPGYAKGVTPIVELGPAFRF